MTNPTREQVFGALLALLTGKVPGIATFSRRVTLPAQLAPSDQPALMLWQQSEQHVREGTGRPAKRLWRAWIVIAFRNADPAVAGATILGPILDGIEGALAPQPGGDQAAGTQTLGGLVTHCWIEGEVLLEPGDTDPQGQGGAVIPLHILVP